MKKYAKSSKSATATRGAPPKVALADLVLDERCQARAKLDPDTVDDYADLLQTDAKLPAIEVFEVDGRRVIVDGFHRYAAATAAEVGFLRCKVVGSGSIEDAAWYAVSVNQAHGLRRSNEDKRRAVRMALESEIGSDQSSHAIAEHVGVSHDFVARIRKQWEGEKVVEAVLDSAAEATDQLSSDDNSEPETVVGRDGKRYRKRKTKPADQLSSDDNSEPEGPTDRNAKIASMIQSTRNKIKRTFGTNQSIDRHLEAAWRAADDLVAIDCSLCDGGGCEFCKKGRTTKGKDRTARDRARSREYAEAAAAVRAATRRAGG